MRLGRLAEAAALLAEAQQAAEDRGDDELLTYVLSSRADLENARGRLDAAVDLERTSLRLRYEVNRGPGPIASCHEHLASFLRKANGNGEEGAAHFIAVPPLRADRSEQRPSQPWACGCRSRARRRSEPIPAEDGRQSHSGHRENGRGAAGQATCHPGARQAGTRSGIQRFVLPAPGRWVVDRQGGPRPGAVAR